MQRSRAGSGRVPAARHRGRAAGRSRDRLAAGRCLLTRAGRLVLLAALGATLALSPLLAPAASAGAAVASAQTGAAGSVPTVALFVVPADELRLLGDEVPFALGVYPPDRSAAAFVEEIGETLRPALARAGVDVRLSLDAGARRVAVEGVTAGFTPTPGDAPRRLLLVGASESLESAVRRAHDARLAFLVGVPDDGRTPVLVARVRARPPSPGGDEGVLERRSSIERGLLAGGATRRPGVLAPYDVAASLLTGLVPGDAGDALRVVEAGRSPLAELDALAERMRRDAGFGPGLTGMTVSFALAGAFVGLLSWRLRRLGVAAAAIRATAAVPLAYVVSLFVPHEAWQVRAAALAGVVAVAALAGARLDARAFAAWTLVGTAALLVALTVLAALRPGGEPALSLWGDPLVSWRFYGLRNHLAAFLVGSGVTGALLLGAGPVVLAIVAAGTVATIGAPGLGANYLGVLTLGTGAGLAVLARWRHRLAWWQPPVAALVAGGGAALALAADRGPGHGAQAVGALRAEGLPAAWRIFSRRTALNYADVSEIGALGWIAFVLLVIALVALLVWGFRGPTGDRGTRVAIVAGVVAALAAVIFEDSGFLMAGAISIFPAIAGLVRLTEDLSARSAMRLGALPGGA